MTPKHGQFHSFHLDSGRHVQPARRGISENGSVPAREKQLARINVLNIPALFDERLSPTT